MNTLTIEVDRVPDAVQDLLARSILEKAVAYFDQPGVEEDFQAWLKGYKKRKAATRVASK